MPQIIYIRLWFTKVDGLPQLKALITKISQICGFTHFSTFSRVHNLKYNFL